MGIGIFFNPLKLQKIENEMARRAMIEDSKCKSKSKLSVNRLRNHTYTHRPTQANYCLLSENQMVVYPLESLGRHVNRSSRPGLYNRCDVQINPLNSSQNRIACQVV